jgi:transposase-like protein
MDDSGKDLAQRFEAAFNAAERQTLAAQLLSKALLEAPCAACNGSSFVLTQSERCASFECPACHARTFVRREGGRLSVLSEQRLLCIVQYIRRKQWFCPEHDGVAVEITGVHTDEQDPLRIHLHFNCRRSRGWRQQRVHAGERALDALTLEAEMLAAAGKG